MPDETSQPRPLPPIVTRALADGAFNNPVRFALGPTFTGLGPNPIESLTRSLVPSKPFAVAAAQAKSNIASQVASTALLGMPTTADLLRPLMDSVLAPQAHAKEMFANLSINPLGHLMDSVLASHAHTRAMFANLSIDPLGPVISSLAKARSAPLIDPLGRVMKTFLDGQAMSKSWLVNPIPPWFLASSVLTSAQLAAVGALAARDYRRPPNAGPVDVGNAVEQIRDEPVFLIATQKQIALAIALLTFLQLASKVPVSTDPYIELMTIAGEVSVAKSICDGINWLCRRR